MKPKAFACFLLIAFVASLASAQHSPSLLNAVRSGAGSNVDWAQFNFDPAHDGYNPYETLLSPMNVANLELKWSYAPPDGEVQGPPVVANGKLYFGAQSGGHRSERVQDACSLYALDAATGGFAWSVPSICALDSPAVANGLVYVDSLDGLEALDANTGALVWQSAQPCSYSPTVINNVVYCAKALTGIQDGIFAVNAQTGALIWRHVTNAIFNSSPTVANGVLYYNSGTGTVDALDANTGALLWEKQLGGSLTVSYWLGGNGLGQSVANGVLYVGVRNLGFRGRLNAKLYALNASTGAII